MKKILTTVFVTAFVTAGFAQSRSLNASAIEKRNIPINSIHEEGNGMLYFKIGAEETQRIPNSDEQAMPGFGIGYRAAYGHHATDFSTEGNCREVQNAAGEKITNFSYTFPRANFYYLSPQSSGSF